MSESICGAAKRVNVAAFDCDEARKFPKKLILGGKAFSTSDVADTDTFYAALIAATKLDTGDANKLYAINNILDPNDVTEANKEGAVGEGPSQVLVEGRPKFTYRVEIGQDLFKRLRLFNKRTIPVFTHDDSGNTWGAKDTAGKFVGAKAIFFISGNTQQTASTPVSALITLTYISAVQYNDEAYYMPVTLGEFEPAGLLDAVLSKVSNITNVYKIDIKAPTAQFGKFINIAKNYNTQLVASLFIAKTGATYATSLALTSVAYDSTLECMTVTFDSTAYTALASGAKIKLYLDVVANLAAADILGIEGVPVILTK